MKASLHHRWSRLNGPTRLAGVDLARGLAIIGMFAAHLIDTDALVWSDPTTWTALVNGRSSILFATLAGVSIALITGGRRLLRGEALARAAVRIGVRALVIWVLGVLLILTGVPVYVILPAYAILFLLVLPLVTLPASALFGIAVGIALVMPWIHALVMQLPVWQIPGVEEASLLVGWHYPFLVWAAFVVAGLGIGRLDLRSAGTQACLVLFGGGLASMTYGIAAVSGTEGARGVPDGAASLPLPQIVWTAAPHSSGVLEVFGSGGFAVAVLGVSLLVCRPWWRGSRMSPIGWATLPLRATGSMPLTAYTAQIVAWAIVATLLLGSATDLRAFRDLSPFWPFALWTIAACTAWALLVGRGPLEWLLERLSGRMRMPQSRADRVDS